MLDFYSAILLTYGGLNLNLCFKLLQSVSNIINQVKLITFHQCIISYINAMLEIPFACILNLLKSSTQVTLKCQFNISQIVCVFIFITDKRVKILLKGFPYLQELPLILVKLILSKNFHNAQNSLDSLERDHCLNGDLKLAKSLAFRLFRHSLTRPIRVQ